MTDAEWESVKVQLTAGQARMDHIEKMIEEAREAHVKTVLALQENTEITKQIKEIVDFGRSFFKFTKYFGEFLKWSLAVAGAVTAIWQYFTHSK